MKNSFLTALLLSLLTFSSSYAGYGPANDAMAKINTYCDQYSNSQLSLFKCKVEYIPTWSVLTALKTQNTPSIKYFLDKKFNEIDQNHISMLIGTYCEQTNNNNNYCYKNNAKYFLEHDFTINNNANVSMDMLPICAANAAGREKPYDYITYCMKKLYTLQ